jgi:hypothetical protein
MMQWILLVAGAFVLILATIASRSQRGGGASGSGDPKRGRFVDAGDESVGGDAGDEGNGGNGD